MIGGRVRHWNINENPTGLDWREVEASSKISAFFIRWRLPPFYVDRTDEIRGVPIFSVALPAQRRRHPLCSEGSGWFMRDEAIAAKRYLETFAELGLPGVAADGLPCDIAPDVAKKIAPCLGFKRLPRRAKDHGLNLLITEAAFFEADETQPRPYAFIPELYEERVRLRREEPGNVAEQNIKLTLNSLSGKAAQSIGGSETNPPRTACPWYAAATTAGTCLAGHGGGAAKPHAIVQFSTDGVVSQEPLNLDIGEGLGQWEVNGSRPERLRFFLQASALHLPHRGRKASDHQDTRHEEELRNAGRMALTTRAGGCASPQTRTTRARGPGSKSNKRNSSRREALSRGANGSKRSADGRRSRARSTCIFQGSNDG